MITAPMEGGHLWPSVARRLAVPPSQPRIDRLALQRQHAEHAFVHTTQRLVTHEPLERLDPECELPKRERPFRVEPTLALRACDW